MKGRIKEENGGGKGLQLLWMKCFNITLKEVRSSFWGGGCLIQWRTSKDASVAEKGWWRALQELSSEECVGGGRCAASSAGKCQDFPWVSRKPLKGLKWHLKHISIRLIRMPCGDKLKRVIVEVGRDQGRRLLQKFRWEIMQSWAKLLAVDVVGSGQILTLFWRWS